MPAFVRRSCKAFKAYNYKKQYKCRHNNHVNYMLKVLLYNKNQLHVLYRTQQVRQREPYVKTHRFPLSAEFWRH